MNRKILLHVLLLLLISTAFSGCIGVNRNFKKIRRAVTENIDVKYNKSFEFSVGRTGLMLAGMVVRLSDVEEPVDDILSEVSRIQVGVYEKASGNLNTTMADLNRITDEMNSQGWRYIVRSVQRDEVVGVFVRGDDPRLRQLYVIAIDSNEMVLVEIHGELSKIVEIAIREKGLKFETAGNHY